MKTILTKKATVLPERREFEQTADSLAGLMLDLKTIEAERAQAIHAVEKQFGERIAHLKSQVRNGVKLCGQFVVANETALLPGPTRSAETPCASYGLRDLPASLDTRTGFTWEKVLEALLESGEERFIRHRPEVARDVLLAAARELRGEERDEFLKQRGLKLTGGTTFWIEPKTKPLAGAVAKEAA